MYKKNKMKYGGMKKKKFMKANKGEIALKDFVEAIQIVGPEHVIISSDAGQARKPLFTECNRVFAQCLYQKGINLKSLRMMMVENQRYLLNISSSMEIYNRSYAEENSKEG